MNPRAATPWADPSAAIDLAVLQGALQRGLPGCADGRYTIDALRVLKARRSSSRRRDPHPITLWLEADLREPATGRHATQRLYGKAYRDGASAAALPAARAQVTTQPAFGDALSHVAELDLLLWAWPNDPGLPQLAGLLNAHRTHESPPSAADELPASQACEVLRYEPEQRATLRCVRRAAGQGSPRVVYGKTFADGRAHTLHQRFQHFWQAAQVDPHAPLVAQPLGVDEATRTLWQAAAPGVPLLERLHGEHADADHRAVGRALAAVHGSGLPTSAVRGLPHWRDELRRRQRKIGRAAPTLAARAERVAATLATRAARLPERELSLIHGDFHPDQVWVHDGRVVLFDFDEFCLGHPMEDLAQFIVKLEQTPLPRHRRDLLTAALIDGYRQAAPHRFCPAGLAWYRALQALLQTSRAFVFQAPGWQDVVAVRLARTETLLEELTA